VKERCTTTREREGEPSASSLSLEELQRSELNGMFDTFDSKFLC
jgi:hypothetical protein